MRRDDTYGPHHQGRIWWEPKAGEFQGAVSGHGSRNPVGLGKDADRAQAVFEVEHEAATGRRYRLGFHPVDGHPGCFMVDGERL